MSRQPDPHRTRPPRFFCPRVAEGPMDLPAAEARHAAGPLRLWAGDAVVLFDGGGLQWPGRIVEIARHGRRVRIEVGPPQSVGREPAVAVTVAAAAPKGRRWDWLLEQCTELGAAAIWALRCQRGIHVPPPEKADAWRRICIEAAKQCGRNRLPDLAGPMTVLEAASGGPFDLAILGGVDEGDPFAALGAAASGLPPQRVLLLIGPEGGFTDAECAAATAAGARLVHLGPTILRTETAAAALLAAAVATWG
jgi:16S rRNA (uracil1498-N3)-methyltransferase